MQLNARSRTWLIIIVYRNQRLHCRMDKKEEVKKNMHKISSQTRLRHLTYCLISTGNNTYDEKDIGKH